MTTIFVSILLAPESSLPDECSILQVQILATKEALNALGFVRNIGILVYSQAALLSISGQHFSSRLATITVVWISDHRNESCLEQVCS